MASEQEFDLSNVPEEVLYAEYLRRVKHRGEVDAALLLQGAEELAKHTALMDRLPLIERNFFGLGMGGQLTRMDIDSLLRLFSERGSDAPFNPRFLAVQANADFATIATHVLKTVTASGVEPTVPESNIQLLFDPQNKDSIVLLPRHTMFMGPVTRFLGGSPLQLGIPSEVLNEGLLVTFRFQKPLEYSRTSVRSSGANRTKAEARLREVAPALPR